MVLSACWRSKSRPARFSAASAEASCALACSTALSSAATWRPMRSMVACWVAILVRARIHRDPVVAVVDLEDHVTGANDRIVGGNDRRDMAGDPRAERGVVGAHIGVVGRDIEASDEGVVDAVADGGERQQSDHTHHHEFRACRISARPAGGIGRRRGRLVGRRRARRVSRPAPGFFRNVRSKLVRQLGGASRAASPSVVSGLRQPPALAGRRVRPGLSLRPLPASSLQ